MADGRTPTETFAMVALTLLVIAIAVNLRKGTLGQWVRSKFAQAAPAGIVGPFSFGSSSSSSSSSSSGTGPLDQPGQAGAITQQPGAVGVAGLAPAGQGGPGGGYKPTPPAKVYTPKLAHPVTAGQG